MLLTCCSISFCLHVSCKEPQYSNYCFSISNASFFYCCLQDFVFFSSLILICLSVDFFAFISGFWTSSICRFKSFAEFEEFSAITFQTFFSVLYSFSPTGTLMTWVLAFVVLPHRSQRLRPLSSNQCSVAQVE